MTNKRQKLWEELYDERDGERKKEVELIAKTLNISYVLAILLYNRGYTDPDMARTFLNFDNENFYDPFLLPDMQAGVERIFAAIEAKQKIYIYGDYDVDGVTSVSTLYLYLTSLGADVGIKIPRREGEGYGVSEDGVRAIASEGARLIITVDTGITANREVEIGRALGVDFVITDHHECHGELPHACAVINPHRPDNEYPFCDLAGVGVVFKTVCAMEIHRCRQAGTPLIDGVKRVTKEYCDLVCVGTIADVMPLVKENRLIVAMGLSKLSGGEGRPGLMSLLSASGKKGDSDTHKKVTSATISFGIAPRINAAGRMSDALIAARLMLATDGDEVSALTEELCRINKQRQEEENSIAEEAYKMLASGRFDGDKVIILDSDRWQQGIIGIVSSKITEKSGLPSILVSFKGHMGEYPDENDDGKGSGRSVKGLNLVDALDACEDLLVKYGGHELAAGLTVKRGRLEEFRSRINEYAERMMPPDITQGKEIADYEIPPSEVSMETAVEIAMLEPFGIGNPAPVFTMKAVNVHRISFIGGGKHTRLVLKRQGIIMNAVYFGAGEGELDIHAGELVDVLFGIEINEFRGTKSVQLLIHDLHRSGDDEGALANMENDYNSCKNGDVILDDYDVIPTREDCAEVYTFLRKEFRAERDTMSILEMLRELNNKDKNGINYIKLKFIFDIFNELKICTVERLDRINYKYNIYFNHKKSDIESSAVLKRLRRQSTGSIASTE